MRSRKFSRKRKMQILDLTSSEPLVALRDKNILVDTNFLIDGYHYPDIFWDIISGLKSKGCTLFTIDAVKYEFMRGSQTIQNYKKKIDFFQKVIDDVRPIGKRETEIVDNLTRSLLKQSAGTSYIDSLLFATCIRYDSPIYLLTSDQSDVPLSIFDMKAAIGIDIGDRSCLFAFYLYNKAKHKQILESLLTG